MNFEGFASKERLCSTYSNIILLICLNNHCSAVDARVRVLVNFAQPYSNSFYGLTPDYGALGSIKHVAI